MLFSTIFDGQIIVLIIVTIIALSSGTTLNDKFPSQGYLYRQKSSSSSAANEIPVCGVSIISRKSVITSASCLYENNQLITRDKLYVIYGNENDSYAKTLVISVHIYRNYHLVAPWKKNLAILKVETNFIFNDWSKKASLSTIERLRYEQTIDFAEWTSEPEIMAKKYYQLSLPNSARLISNEQCATEMNLDGYNPTFHKFCAVASFQDRNCTIAHGTGLVSNGVLVGIQSGCRSNNGVRIYTDIRILKYINWIVNTVADPGALDVTVTS